MPWMKAAWDVASLVDTGHFLRYIFGGLT